MAEFRSKFDIMKLFDIVKNSHFKISKNKANVIESFYSVIYMLTGQYLSKSHDNKHYCDLIYKLIQKYSKRKKNKEKFLEIEEDLLQRQEVNL